MNKVIKYISFFDFQDSTIKRNYVVAATNKMESICESLNRCGYDVKIISFSQVIEPKFKFYRGKTVKRHNGLTLKLFSSWGGNCRPLRIMRNLWHLVAAFIYMLFTLKKDDTVLVYHSLGYFNTVLWAKKIKRFKMILEVEELYLDVSDPKYKAQRAIEPKMIESADAYIFPTELLDSNLNIHNKPSVIIYGTYKVEPQRVEKFDDGKIHAVYAGTFDPRKGGAAAAAAAAMYLPENYHIHICGFGTEEDTEDIKKQIKEISAKSKATLTFDGMKLGNSYIEFIQKCHIGLSTQNPDAAFNSTSFPSKILSYMANGLSVVSIDIPVIRKAEIGKYITYYTKQDARHISEAILNAPIENDQRQIISKLKDKFDKDLKEFLTFWQ